jgi:hypothetical protein
MTCIYTNIAVGVDPSPRVFQNKQMRTNIDDPDYWFSRAEEARVIAESMRPAGRNLMLIIARDYELLAGLAKSGLQKEKKE